MDYIQLINYGLIVMRLKKIAGTFIELICVIFSEVSITDYWIYGERK